MIRTNGSIHKFVLNAEKVNCEAREAALGCKNFDSAIVKTVEWYIESIEINKI